MGRSSISEDKTDELELRQQNIQGYKDNKESKPRAGIVEDQWHNGRIPAVCSSTWPCAPIYTYVYVLCSCLASFSAVVVLILSPFHIDFLLWSLDYWDPLGSDINKNDIEKIQNKIKTCTTTRETSRNINGRWSDIIALDRVVGRWPWRGLRAGPQIAGEPPKGWAWMLILTQGGVCRGLREAATLVSQFIKRILPVFVAAVISEWWTKKVRGKLLLLRSWQSDLYCYFDFYDRHSYL